MHLFQAGLIRTDSSEFFIEPLERGRQNDEENGRAHVVYRRSALQDKTGTQGEMHNEGTLNVKHVVGFFFQTGLYLCHLTDIQLLMCNFLEAENNYV